MEKPHKKPKHRRKPRKTTQNHTEAPKPDEIMDTQEVPGNSSGANEGVNLIQANFNGLANDISCESLSVIPSEILANIWELLNAVKLSDDQLLPDKKAKLYRRQITELKDCILNNLLDEINKSTNKEVEIFEKLHSISLDESFTIQQRVEIKCIISSLNNRNTENIIERANVSDDHSSAMERLNRLLELTCISNTDKKSITEKMKKIQTNKKEFVYNDSIQSFDQMQKLMQSPFMKPEDVTCVRRKMNKLRLKMLENLSIDEDSESFDDDLQQFDQILRHPKLSESSRVHMIEKMDSYKRIATGFIKKNKNKLKDELSESCEQLIKFKGTNLEFIEGYANFNPSFIRCIRIWQRHKS